MLDLRMQFTLNKALSNCAIYYIFILKNCFRYSSVKMEVKHFSGKLSHKLISVQPVLNIFLLYKVTLL